MHSPAKAHYLRHTAAREAAKASPRDGMEGATGYELMLAKLAQDRRRLKEIQSIERKIVVKRELLPDYVPWVDGVLATGNGAQDDVLMTVLVWRIDTGDFPAALAIARYAIGHRLSLPDQYERSLGCLLAEEFADTALKAITADERIDLDSLLAVADLTAEQDMPDEVRAKLHKAIGLALAGTDKPLALEQLRRALVLHDKAGVKKDIERLEREIRNAGQDEAQGAPPEDGAAPDNAAPAQPGEG